MTDAVEVDETESSRFRGESLLLGRDSTRAVRLAGVAGLLFALTALFHLPPRLVGPLGVGFGFFLPALVGLAVVASAAGAYYNDGLLTSVALAGGVGYGFFLPLAAFDLAYPSETVLWALGTGGGFAVVLGSAGFLVGAAARRLLVRVP